MSLLTVLLSLFFFSGFATAGIYAPDCSLSTWQWVCVLSFPLCIPCRYSCLIRWLFGIMFRHSTVSAKMLARSQRTCCPPAAVAVSLVIVTSASLVISSRL